MTLFGASLGLTTPLLLWALALLPVVWFLLRVVPPSPIVLRFPAIVLLAGLDDRDAARARTPPWLLLLRLLVLAAAIIGLAGPVLNPDRAAPRGGPLLLVTDASWADAPDWSRRRALLADTLDDARRAGRSVAVVALTAPRSGPVTFSDGAGLREWLAALSPAAWEPAEAGMATLAGALPDGEFDTLWLSDGLDRAGRTELYDALAAHGHVEVVQSPAAVVGLAQRSTDDGSVGVRVLQAGPDAGREVTVQAVGPDPAGAERELASAQVTLPAGDGEADATLDLPPELRNRVTRFQIAGHATAGAVSLADEGIRRRKVGLVAAANPQEGLELLSPLHYLHQALAPTTDLVEGTLDDVLRSAPQVVVLADVARMPEAQSEALKDWVADGGLLVRFAGPRLAAEAASGRGDDPLLPVRLRPGGRSFGGAMSWGSPRAVAPFAEDSPFHGLAVPADVTVSSQVLAEPSPELAARTVAALDDGTPLVTRAPLDAGQVVLFHIPATADWSSLPISGLFVRMLDRLAVTSRPASADLDGLAGSVWKARSLLDAFGVLAPADDRPGIDGPLLAGPPSAAAPPGLYESGGREFALNAVGPERRLAAAAWPAGTALTTLDPPRERPLAGLFLAAAVLGLAADVLATALLGGRLRRRGSRAGRLAGVATLAGALGVMLALAAAPGARAEEDPATLAAAAEGMALAHILTGDARVDAEARAGLLGLSMQLTARTSVEPGEPVAVDIEADDLSLYSFLYWPVTVDQKAPSLAAYQKLNRFLQTGGMILFDTRDADMAGGSATPEGRALQELAAMLDIPPLERVPADHVLTRSFYLLQDFPGRYADGPVWVEAAPPDAEMAEGMPFRNLNDGVTPVVIGGNDWAAAWAVEDDGVPMFQVGRGLNGDRQREIAYRFGINLVMHVLTGNYKSDQVHVPALLERLGQ